MQSLNHVVIFLLTSLFLLLPSHTFAKDKCTNSQDKYTCYGTEVNKIISQKGVASAMEYVHRVVLPTNGYSIVHIVLHSVGEAAYFEQKKDLTKTLSYMRPYTKYARDGQYLNGFDGFYHGAITAYFFDNKDSELLQSLVAKVCEGQVTIPGIGAGTFECYHTVGHALMNALGNKLQLALASCDQQPSQTAQAGCYYGVFMENSFLYSSSYHPGLPRPDVEGSSMVSVCARFESEKNYYCSHFVGQVYLTTHPGDMKGAFDECKKLKTYNTFCIQRLGVMFIPSHYKGDYSKMIKTCDYAGTQYVSICKAAVDQGVKLGFGGDVKNSKAEEFISFLKGTFLGFLWR